MDFTLFEVHVPNAEIKAPFSDRDRDDWRVDWPTPESGSAARVAPIAAVVALVGLALLARYLRGGDAEQTTLDEVEA